MVSFRVQLRKVGRSSGQQGLDKVYSESQGMLDERGMRETRGCRPRDLVLCGVAVCGLIMYGGTGGVVTVGVAWGEWIGWL